jgi:hypothetical protein
VGKYSAEPFCTKEIEAQLDAGGNATVTDCKHVPCDNLGWMQCDGTSLVQMSFRNAMTHI